MKYMVNERTRRRSENRRSTIYYWEEFGVERPTRELWLNKRGDIET